MDGPYGDEWSRLGREILRGERQLAEGACPNCGAHDLAIRKVGRPDSPSAYAEVTCTTCRHGIYIVGAGRRDDQRRRAPGGG